MGAYAAYPVPPPVKKLKISCMSSGIKELSNILSRAAITHLTLERFLISRSECSAAAWGQCCGLGSATRKAQYYTTPRNAVASAPNRPVACGLA